MKSQTHRGFLAIAICLCLVGSVALLAQTGGRKPGKFNVTVQTRPQAIPTVLTDIVRQDAYVCYVDLTANGQTITIQDRQAPAVGWLNNVLGTAGSVTTWLWWANDDTRCRWMPGGFSWQASATGATGYLTFKCEREPCLLVSGQ